LDVQMSNQEPLDNVLYGYAFNVTRCEGLYGLCCGLCPGE